jgi:hypothetical protein
VNDLHEAIRFIRELKATHPDADKERIQAELVRRLSPQRQGSLFLGPGYALRFSQIKGHSFRNTVLALSALQRVDERPVVVCVVEPRTVRFLLANSTFLKKISHSSLQLSMEKVRGSFNGTDILTEYGGISNEPESFEELFSMHLAFTWSENLERLVQATTGIAGRKKRFRPTDAQRRIILEAPERAVNIATSTRFVELEDELRANVHAREVEILRAAAVENVNLRGNRIEQLVTGGTNAHALGDLRVALGPGDLVIDVKTKLLGRPSAPKAYNIDKMLSFHAEPESVFAFLVLGIDMSAGVVVVRLVPVLDSLLIGATRIQHHWASRTSRGVTQLTGSFAQVLKPDFRTRVDLEQARIFLLRLLDG